jgi:rfaE bifunctional protein nucleotidyltransferase chain/domain
MNAKPALVKARLLEIESGKIRADFAGKKEIAELLRRKFIAKSGAGFALTDAGRKQVKIVMTGGVFDIIHLGHVQTLENARKMGDALVVVVAHDATVRRQKGRKALHSAQERAALLRVLRCVDLALVGHPRDREVTVRRVRPDIVVFGYDQKHDMRLKAKVMRLRTRLKGRAFKTSGLIDDM